MTEHGAIAIEADGSDRFRLAFKIPANWLAISVPKRQAEAEGLADALAASYKRAGPSSLLRTLALQAAHACAVLGVVSSFVTVIDEDSTPQPATLLVSTYALGGRSLGTISDELTAADEHIRQQKTDLLTLPAGPAIRAEWFRDWPGPPAGRNLSSLTVQYLVPAPDQAKAAILTFSAPAPAAADRLRRVFDQIAQTVEFRKQGPS